MANIKFTKNGPIKLNVSAGDVLEDSEGNKITLDSEEVYLCRCGQSSSKPFCDGTHAILGFDSSKDIQDFVKQE